MRTLFFKIFVWFWLAMATVSIVLIVSTATTSPGPRWRSPMIGRPLMMHGRMAARIYEQEGEAALSDYIASVAKVTRLDPFMFNEHGQEISGREPSAAIKELAAQALQRGEPEPILSEKAQVVAQNIYTPSGNRYVLIGRFDPQQLSRAPRRPPFPWLRIFGFGDTETSTLLLRLAAVLGAAGIVCYGLARYLTAPLVRLRTATHRLASGDLKARFGTRRGGRQDELTELGKDFDLMAERIEAIMAAQRRLLSDISHELRSPLARINLAVGLIRQRQRTQSDPELERIELEAKRLDTLIGQLLRLTRMESGEDGSERESVELLPLLKTIVDDADFEAQSRDRTVRITRSEPLTIHGNQEMLHSAIENVVRNAVHYTAEGTTVEVTLERQRSGYDPFAIIRVRDHGSGVPDSSLPDLFRPFYRVADARERESGGVGLGLAIAEQSVRWHGGSINASNAPDSGLLVEIRLPGAEIAAPSSSVGVA
jgi:two-component system sensor histidine kinase CpxA